MAAIFAEEQGRYHTPFYIGQSIGLGMGLAVIAKHGTPEQFQRFATPTVAGDVSWCQLFSEPGAGSDLAACAPRRCATATTGSSTARRSGPAGPTAPLRHPLARTDPSAPKHEGLTFFVVDMNTPGVEVRPIRQITGKSDFNETFFDRRGDPRRQPHRRRGRGLGLRHDRAVG